LDGWRAICQKNGVVFADPELGNKQRKREGLVEPKSIDEIGNLFRGCLPPKRRKPDTKCEVNEPIKKQKALQLSDTVVDPVFGIAHHIPQTSIAPMTGNANPATLSQIHQPSTVARTKRNMDQMYGHAYNEDLSKLPNLPVHILKKSRKTKCHDNTRTRRQAIILDIIEKDRICEHSFELFKQCNEIEQAASGGPNMARRTFGTIIQQLHDEQKIRLYRTSIQTPFGLTEIKTLILHPSLTGESDQVKQFIASYNSHNTKIPVVTETPKRKALKKVEVDTPLPPLHRDSQKATTAKQVNSDNSNDAPGTWHFNATEYGYLNSKWLRAREFHMALFEYYKNNSENTTVDLSEFMKRMCLRRLMRFFGLLPYDNKILFDYLKTDANQDIPLNDLPDQIKPMIIKAMPRIRGSIMKNITVLKALELLEPDTEVDMARVGIPLTVTLRLTGLVKDYALKERPLLAALTLTDLDDARLFWVDLQAYCTQLHDRLTATNDDSDPLARIAGCRGWTSNTLLTPEQKTLLNSFVDFDAQTVPREEDRALRSHLMRKTGLPIGRIMAYFNSIMVAFKKYKTRSDRTRKRLEKKLSNPSSPAIRELLKASLEKRKVSAALFKMKETSPFVEPTFIGSRKIRHLRLQVEPYQDKPHGNTQHCYSNGITKK
jgi:hypothetical protein